MSKKAKNSKHVIEELGTAPEAWPTKSRMSLAVVIKPISYYSLKRGKVSIDVGERVSVDPTQNLGEYQGEHLALFPEEYRLFN